MRHRLQAVHWPCLFWVVLFFSSFAAAAPGRKAPQTGPSSPTPTYAKWTASPTPTATPVPIDRQEHLKYFHEPGSDDILGHYDKRFFHGPVSYEVRTETLTHMIRAYLNTFRELGLETWIAHGTLLGWWWNGKMLPWDWDVDTQVSGATLIYMADHFNRTKHHYTSEEDNFERTYLLDVNPYARERTRGNGANIIDARWIDTKNGLYIDITALSELHPDEQPGVWSCKNFHRYKTTDLYPMRDSIYEGVPARIPYAYDKILVEEYKEKALASQDYEGHRWHPDNLEWVETPEGREKKRKKEEQKRKEEQEKKELEKKRKQESQKGKEQQRNKSGKENNEKQKTKEKQKANKIKKDK